MSVNSLMAFWGSVFGRHKYALATAVAVGLIYLAPHIFFIWSLGDNYRGIPMMLTANEDFYLSRMQEILDGHPLIGSPFFFEYKDQWPLTPPVGEMFYVIPAKIFNVSLVNILTTGRFVLPFILFLLVYLLIYRLSGDGESAAGKINAIAGALLVTLGYDLVDFRNFLGFLAGHNSLAGGFLLWSRPVNPILGAIFLISFLMCVWQIVDGVKYKRTAIFGASVFLAFMMASYFFSWGMALSVLAALIAIYCLRGRWSAAGELAAVIPLAVILAAPYWYMVWRARGSELYADSVLRSGLFYTHYPVINKLMLAVLAVFVLFVFLPPLWRKLGGAFAGGAVFGTAREENDGFRNWHWFCLSVIAGSFWVYGQQLITGITIWHYHFVQYSIPLAMIVLTVLFYNVVRKNWPRLWVAGAGIVIVVSLLTGIGTQASVYREQYAYQASMQSYAPLFDWLNRQEKDCVVLASRGVSDRYDMNILISAFTHCNGYASNAVFSMMPNARPIDNYMAILRLRGVSPDAIDSYILRNRSEAIGYLFSNWNGLFTVKDFPDFSDKALEDRLKKFPEDYKNFAARDFESALKKYKIDYIFSASALAPNIAGQFRNLKLVFTADNIFIYQITNGTQ